MRIKAKIKGTGQELIGFLIERRGEPCILCEIKNNISLDNRKSCIYGIYLDTIEFDIQGQWVKFMQGMELLIGLYGKASIPNGIYRYFKSKAGEPIKEKDN